LELIGFQGSRVQGDKEVSKMLKSYKDLKVWQKAYQLCLEVYKITKPFPSEERYGLTFQIRRATVSIPSNIAEGYGRRTTGEYLQSLYISYGSVCELETQILLSRDLDYLSKQSFERIEAILGEVERMLKALIKSVERT
jgi:four helix bundle protein